MNIPADTPYQWEICIGNGWRECPVEVGYVGNLTIPDLTSGNPPSPIDMPTMSPTPAGGNSAHPTRSPNYAPTPYPTPQDGYMIFMLPYYDNFTRLYNHFSYRSTRCY